MPSFRSGRSVAVLLFALVQVLVLVVVGWGAYRASQRADVSAVPPLREIPLEVLPEYNDELVVDDEQLARVLVRLRPLNAGPETKINHVDHALRFWTAQAAFRDPNYFSGEALRRLLTDQGAIAQLYGEAAKPLLEPRQIGVAVRTQKGLISTSHFDHATACLAEVGTPLDYPVITPQGETTFRSMVEFVFNDFSLNQFEYEWTALVFLLYLPQDENGDGQADITEWTTPEGQRVSFDIIADRIMRESRDNGVCFANHRMHALVMTLRIDEQMRIISDQTREEIIAYLQNSTRLLIEHQHAYGFWNANWPHEKPKNAEPADVEGDRLGDRILATGHALEWWALAPKDVLPPREVYDRAGQWMVKTIDALNDDEIQQYYTYLTHSGRALALWRGKYPSQVRLEEPPAKSEKPTS